MANTLDHLELSFGDQKTATISYVPDALAGRFKLPESRSEVESLVDTAFTHPINFPPVHEAIVPGDKITLAIDGNVPEIGVILDGIWRQLKLRDIQPKDVTLLQSPMATGGDPRRTSTEAAVRSFQHVIHDPSDERKAGYLATSTKGDRIYLSRVLTDADFVLTIGTIQFDEQFGIAGTNSGLYPALSVQEEIDKHIGRGHSELTPFDDRPLRSVADEVGWLLGIQFTLQVIPGARGSVSHVLAGCNESVFRQGRNLLADQSSVTHDCRSETVLVTVDSINDHTSWGDVIDAIDSARRLVERDGRIVVLSSLRDEIPETFERIIAEDFPADAQQSVWNPKTVDSPIAGKLLQAVEWARVYLLSECKDSVIEDLFMIPVASEVEVNKLLNSVQEFFVLENGQHVYVSVE